MNHLARSRSAAAVIEGLQVLAAQAQLDELADWMRHHVAQATALVERLLAAREASGPAERAAPASPGSVRWDALSSLVAEGQTAAIRRRDNVAALTLLRSLDGQPATGTQRGVLARYSGWGGVVAKAADVDKIPSALRPADWRGLVDEYYTPGEVCRSVWRVVARLVDEGLLTADPDCLEPAAGIGRFIRTAPKGLRWRAVELSPQAAGILSALEPDLELHDKSFQEFMASQPPPVGGDVDLVVTNPPYASQGEYVRFDRRRGKYRGKHWPKAEQYFLHAAMRRTRADGIIVQLVPLGVVTGGKSQKRLRQALLEGCHWLGAYALPGDLFPGARLGLALVVLQRRAAPLTAVAPGDQDVLDGRYFETPAGRQNVGGRWASEVAAEQGKSAYRELVVATPDALPLEQMVIAIPGRPPAASVRAPEPPKSESPPVSSSLSASEGRSKVVPAASMGPEEVATYQRAVGLGRRIVAWRSIVTAGDDVVRAETQRHELVADLGDWVASHGDPHAYVKALDAPGDRKALGVFSAAWLDGQPSAELGEPIELHAVSAYPGDSADVAAVVRFLSGRHGETRWDDIVRIAPTARQATLPASVMVEWVPGEGWLFFDEREYLSGDLYARLDRLETATRDKTVSLTRSFRKRLVRQRKLLLDRISPQPIEQIDIDFRNGLVSGECLSEWLTEVNDANEVTARWEDGLLFVDGETLSPQVQDIAAFASRLEQYDRRGESKKSRRHEAKASLQQKMTLDRQLLEEFNWWVRAHERWAPHLEDTYNRAFRSWHPRTGDAEPLAMARAASKVTLRDHQVAAIRSLSEARAGIIGHDVGLGKTFLALGLVAWWRQHGMTRRPIIVVPKQVATNWLREAQTLLPDYEVGVVGLTWSERKNGYREDRPDDKQAKWKAFARGDYDLLLVTQPAFEEISVTPETSKNIMERSLWLRREEKLQEGAANYQTRRVAAKKKELAESYQLTERQADKLRDEIRAGEDQLAKMTDRVSFLEGIIERTERELAVTGEAAAKTKLKKALGRHRKSLAKERKKPTLRQLESAREKFEQWRVLTEFERETAAGGELGITWEDLGCDLLLLDEAHAYKNLFRPETRYGQSPKYLGNSGGDECKRCWDLWVKSTYLRDQHDGTGVLLLTATPLKNSPLELYSMLQYVRPEVFTTRGIRTHEEFIDRYCGFSDAAVLDTTGQLVDRLVVDRFEHLDEIRAILNLYVDLRDAEDVGLPVPEHVSVQVSVPMTSEQTEVYAELRELGREAISGSSDTNILTVLHEMGLAALDLRLLDPAAYASFRPPKYVELAQNILNSVNCAHIVFISQSKRASLDYCVEALVAAGIKPAKIVTMHGGVKQGERQRIVDALNDGTYDVMVGNQVMSEGLNLQARACSIHHIDLPWTPSDIQQRNGRAVRQGNQFAASTGQPVTLHYYLTEGSSDGYRLQLIAGKRGWLHTLVKSSATSANNPLAGAATSEDDLIAMFAEDPAAARAELAKKKVAAAAVRLEERKQEVVKRFHQYASVLQRSRQEPDPGLAARFTRQAKQLERFLGAFSEEAFPKAMRPLLVEARSSEVLWLGGDVVMRPHTAVRLSDHYGVLQVQSINLSGRAITLRRQGTFPSFTIKAEDLHPAAAEWNSDSDRAELIRTADGGYVSWDARAMHRVPADLVAEFGQRLWARLVRQTWSRGPDSIPYVDGASGRLVIRTWKQALAVPLETPLMPYPEDWGTFLATPGGTEGQRELAARRWFRRALPQVAAGDGSGAKQPNPQLQAVA